MNCVHNWVKEYEFRFDGGQGYTPSEHERAMIEDAINGYLADSASNVGRDQSPKPPGVAQGADSRVEGPASAPVVDVQTAVKVSKEERARLDKLAHDVTTSGAVAHIPLVDRIGAALETAFILGRVDALRRADSAPKMEMKGYEAISDSADLENDTWAFKMKPGYMQPIETATIVKIFPTIIWIERCFSGDLRVMMQHEGCEKFTYATFHYDYRYTSNAGQWDAATKLALSLGATEPVPTAAPSQDVVQEKP